MKPRQPSSPPTSPGTTSFLAAKTLAILILFSLGYSLGLLSSSRANNSDLVPHTNATVVKEDDWQPPPSSPIPARPPPHDLLRFRRSCSPPLPAESVQSTLLQKLFDDKNPFTDSPSPATSSHLLPPNTNPRGWGSRGSVFADLIEATKPSVIVELGAFLGASAIHMASVSRNVSSHPALILAVDDFRGWPGMRLRLRRDLPDVVAGDSMLLQQFMANVAAAGVSSSIMPVPFSTSSALATLCEWGVYADLIEVDAGHDFHSAWSDINMAWAVLRPGGVMFGHDYFTKADNRGVRRAVTLFATTNNLAVRAHGEHWVLSPKPQPDTAVAGDEAQ